MVAKPRLGDILLRAGVVDPDQLRAALGEQRRWGRRLGLTLIAMGALTERDLVRALASQLNLPVVHLAGKRIDAEILELIPLELAEKHGCLPLFVKPLDGISTLHLGMEDPSDVEAIDDARFRSGMPVVPIMVSHSDLEQAILRSYRAAGEADAGIEMGSSEAEDEAALSLQEYSDVGLDNDVRAVGSTEMLTALTELLIEKGLLGREEIADRIKKLRRC